MGNGFKDPAAVRRAIDALRDLRADDFINLAGYAASVAAELAALSGNTVEAVFVGALASAVERAHLDLGGE